MALTPEDVVNKRFESTKFREGYDQDDVDDFLDEVVVELRRLNQENDELRQRLTASESRSNELQQSTSNAPAAPAPVAASVPAAIESAPAPSAPAPEPVSSALDDASSTNNLLQLARRLHEEHVRDGIAKRDALIAEGQESAAEILADAEAKQREQVGMLEKEREAIVGTLDEERQAIESRIESLQNFEREYREKLKSYIEGQLHELDSDSLVSAGAPAQDSAQQDSSQQDSSQQESSQQDAAPAAQSAGHLSPEDFAAPQSAQRPPASFTGFSGS
ncbi:DivIVA domain-containing protein [Rhodoglobus aureus]